MVQSTAMDAVSATGGFDAEEIVDGAFATVRPQLIEIVESLRGPVTPAMLFHFELIVFGLLREFGRILLEALFNSLEGDGLELPHDVMFRGQGYRRLGKKTRNQHVATLFGKICLWRFPYRFWERGANEPCIFPLELQLGLVQDVTPALTDLIGRRMAEAGATQKRVLEQLRKEHGVSMGVKRLRNLVAALAEGFSEYREASQVEALLKALQEADFSRGNRKPVIAVGRDGITLRQYKNGIFEIATAATITVFDRSGKRLTTVYLAWRPELGQATMSEMLTSLLTEVLKQWDGPLPTLSYITDSGSNESSYFKHALERMCHPRTGKRLVWQRVADYYHAAERVWKMSEKLFGKKSKRYQQWARRMLRLLKKPNGPNRVLHSAATHKARRNARRKFGKKRLEEFNTAYNYIRNRTKWMQYSQFKNRHIPLGSGITEAACKTLYTQRLKLSGMCWKNEGAQRILSLRTILLSSIWSTTYDMYLASLENLIPLPYAPSANQNAKIAA
jgi:hypothetical protein